jgi:hypothetical protein
MRVLYSVWIGCALISAGTPLVGQTPSSLTNDVEEAEIVVIARKLKRWKSVVRDLSGTVECRTVKTSGDPAIDELGCRALRTCIIEQRPALTKAYESEKRIRKQRVAEAFRDLDSCVVPRRKQFIRDHVRSG